MNLFVIDKENNQKVYLDVSASTRSQLAEKIGKNFYLAGKPYSVSDVVAGKDNKVTAGAVTGGITGTFFGGPIGMILGGVIGAFIGDAMSKDDEVNYFNNSSAL